MKRKTKKLTRKEEILLVRVAEQPYSSPAELAQWPDVDQNTVHYYLGRLMDDGYVGYEIIGWIRDSQQRYFLRSQGRRVLVRQRDSDRFVPTNVPDTAKVLTFGPCLEALYYVGPRAWSHDHIERAPKQTFVEDSAVNPDQFDAGLVIHRDVKPIRFYWMLEGPVHAVMEYVEPSWDASFFLPLIWYGPHARRCQLPTDPRELLPPFAEKHEFGACPVPPGVCVVAADELALYRALREIPVGLPLMGIAVGAIRKKRFAITGIYPMENPIDPFASVFVDHTDEDIYRSLRYE